MVDMLVKGSVMLRGNSPYISRISVCPESCQLLPFCTELFFRDV